MKLIFIDAMTKVNFSLCIFKKGNRNISENLLDKFQTNNLIKYVLTNIDNKALDEIHFPVNVT